jgi:hypothetical protein
MWQSIPWFAGLLTLTAPSEVLAWKPYTHNITANEALADAVDDGLVTINGRQYALRPEVVAALRAWPQFYNAGVIGPDGFPDLTYGQAIIHPGSTAHGVPAPGPAEEAALTGAWLRHLHERAWAAQSDPRYTVAQRAQILAFTYGFLTHAAGDMWGHTLINDFADGVFPAIREIPTDIHKGENALRHLIAEGYVGDATPGFDGFQDSDDPRDARGPAPGSDISDDATPGFAYEAPHAFIFDALIDEAAATPLPDRGPLIDFFLDLRAGLAAAITVPPDPIQEAVDAYDDTVALLMSVEEDCNFEDVFDIAHDVVACPLAVGALGVGLAIDSLEAFLAFSAAVVEDALLLVFNSYLNNWIEDIDRGLRRWSEFGLATTQGLFDPQARRNVQNQQCDCPIGCEESGLDRAECEDDVSIVDTIFSAEGTANDFINDPLLSMLGLPDFVGGLREILQEFAAFLDDILDVLTAPFNPIRELQAALEQFFEDLVQDAISDALGIDIAALDDLLKHPSRWLCLDQTQFSFPDPLGTVTVTLFPEGEHARLDGLLHLPEPHHVDEPGLPEGCGRLLDTAEVAAGSSAAYRNTMTTAKLLLLDGPELNSVLTDLLGRTISFYQPGQNVMIDGMEPQTWLELIDGDHAWRADGLPRFCSPETECPPGATFRDAGLDGGTGLLPVWASCVMRPAFRQLFQDWENGVANFPDLGDALSADPADDPNPPTSFLARTGAFYDDGVRQFIGGDNAFTQTAHDTPADRGFEDGELGLQRRTYTDLSNRGPFVDAFQGETFSIGPPDGVHFVDIRAADACHSFSGVPLPPEATQTYEYWRDTTAPFAVCNTPPFGLVFDTDDTSSVSYGVADGTNGSGVASSSSTVDGYLTLPGIAPIANGALLDMYFYYPGTRTVAVSLTDNIGNPGLTNCTFEIHASAVSLLGNLDRAYSLGLIRNQGIYRSLRAKLEAAKKHHDRGQHTPELNVYRAYVHELQAQRGQGVDAATADRFVASVQDLIQRHG